MRKNWKKVLSLLLAIAMVFSMNTTAFASGDISASEDNGSTVTEAVPEETPAVEEAAAEAAAPEDEIQPVGDPIQSLFIQFEGFEEGLVDVNLIEWAETGGGSGSGTGVFNGFGEGNKTQIDIDQGVVTNPVTVTVKANIKNGYGFIANGVGPTAGTGLDDQVIGTITSNTEETLVIEIVPYLVNTTLTWDTEKVNEDGVSIVYITSENGALVRKTSENRVGGSEVIWSQKGQTISVNFATETGWKVKTPLPTGWNPAADGYEYVADAADGETGFASGAFEPDKANVVLSWNKGQVDKVEVRYQDGSGTEQSDSDYNWTKADAKTSIAVQKGTSISLNVTSENKYHVTGYRVGNETVVPGNGYFVIGGGISSDTIVSINTAANEAPTTVITPAEQNAYNSATFTATGEVAGIKYLVVSHNTTAAVIDKIESDTSWQPLTEETITVIKAVSVNSDGTLGTIPALEQATVYDVLLAYCRNSKIDSPVARVALKPTGTRTIVPVPGWTVSSADTVTGLFYQYNATNKTLIVEAGGTGDIVLEPDGQNPAARVKLNLTGVNTTNTPVNVSANQAFSIFVDAATDAFVYDPESLVPVVNNDVLYVVSATPVAIPNFDPDDTNVKIEDAKSVIKVAEITTPGTWTPIGEDGKFNGYNMAAVNSITPILVKFENTYEQFKLNPKMDESERDALASLKKVKTADFVNSLSANAKVSFNQYTLVSKNEAPTGSVSGAKTAKKDENIKFDGLNPDYTYWLAVRAVSENYFSTPWAILGSGVKPFRAAPTELKSVTVLTDTIRTTKFTLSVNQQKGEEDVRYLVVSGNSNADKALAAGKYVGRAADDWKATTNAQDSVTNAVVSGNEGVAPITAALVPGTEYVVYAVYVDGSEFNSLPFKTNIVVTTEKIRKAVATLTVSPASAEYAGTAKKVGEVFKLKDSLADDAGKALSDNIVENVEYVILSGNSTEANFKGTAADTRSANPDNWKVSDSFGSLTGQLPVGSYKAKAYITIKGDVDYIKNKTLSSNNMVDFKVTKAPITPSVNIAASNEPGKTYKTGDEYTIVEGGTITFGELSAALSGRKEGDDAAAVDLPAKNDTTFTVEQGSIKTFVNKSQQTYKVSTNATGDKVTISLSANSDKLLGTQSGNYAKQEVEKRVINVAKDTAPTIETSGKDLTWAYLQSAHVEEEFVRDVYEMVTVKKDGTDVTKMNPTIKVSVSSNKDWIDVKAANASTIASTFASKKVGDKVYLSANYVGINSEDPAAVLEIKPSKVAIVPVEGLSAKAKAKSYSTSYNKAIDVYALTVAGKEFKTAEAKGAAIKDWTTTSTNVVMIKDQAGLKAKINANKFANTDSEFALADLTIYQKDSKSVNYVIKNPAVVKYTIQPVMDKYIKLASAKAASQNLVVEEGVSRNKANLKFEIALDKVVGKLDISGDNIYRDISWYAFVTDENGNKGAKINLAFKKGASTNEVTYDAGAKKFTMDLSKHVTDIDHTADVTVYVNVIERAKQPYDVEKSDTKLTILPMNTVVYNGMKHVSTQKSLAKGEVGDLEVVITSGDYQLTEGIDYKVTYKNNVDAGSYEKPAGAKDQEAKAPKVIVNGLGQYKGMYFEQYFIIEPAELSAITVTGLATSYKLNSKGEFTPKFTGQLGNKKINAKNLFAKFGDGAANKSGTKLSGSAGDKLTVTFSTDDPNYVKDSTFDYTFSDGTAFETILVKSTAKKLSIKRVTSPVQYSADGIDASAFAPQVKLGTATKTAGTDYEAKLYIKDGKNYVEAGTDGADVKDAGSYYLGVRPTTELLESGDAEDVIVYKAVKINGKNFTSNEKKAFTTKYNGKAVSTKTGSHIAIADPAEGYDIELTAPKLDNKVGYIVYDVTGKNVVKAGEFEESETIAASAFGKYNRTPGTYKIDIFGKGAYNSSSKVTLKYTVDPIDAKNVTVLVYDDGGDNTKKDIKFNIGGYVYNEEKTNSDFGQVKLGLKVGNSEDEYLTSLLKGAKVNITGSKIGDGKITITNVKASGKAVIKGTVKADIKIVKNDLSGSTSANANAGNKGIQMVDTGITATKLKGNAQKGENFLKLYQASAKLGIDSQGNFKTKALTKNKHYTFKLSKAEKGEQTATFKGANGWFENEREEDIVIAADMYTADSSLKTIKVNSGQPVTKKADEFDGPVYPDVTVGSYTLKWNDSEYAVDGTAPEGFEIVATPADNIFVGNKATVTVTFKPVADGYKYTGSKTVKFKIKAAK